MIWIKKKKVIPKNLEIKILKQKNWIHLQNLIRILKTKKKAKELIKSDRKPLITFSVLIILLAYFYPVIKHTKNKLDCEAIAKNYIVNNKNIVGINNKQLKMLSTNFCYGGEEIYEIENSKN